MKIQELREKIAQSDKPEWFNNLELENPIFQGKIQGLVNIYERVIAESEQWRKYDNLPGQLGTSMNFWTGLNSEIDRFLNYSFASTYNLSDHWRNITSWVKMRNQNNTNIYSIQEPKILFLLDVSQKNNEYYEKVERAITNTDIRNTVIGQNMAYEFLRPELKITERHEIETELLENLRKEFSSYIDKAEKELNSNKKAFEDELARSKSKLEGLEELYREKLKLEEPAKYWKQRADTLSRQGKYTLIVLALLIVISISGLAYILINPPEEVFNVKKSTLPVVRWSIIYATILSLLAVGIRALMKSMFSSYHLAQDCEERHTLTYFYLALLKDKNVDEKDRQLIMQSLFSRAETGLLKEDSSPTMPSDFIGKFMGK